MDESSDKELERYILKQVPFEKLPPAVKVLVENSKAKWKQYVIRYSIRHQLRWKTNIISTVVPDERNYYQEIIRISRLNFMLYPYHISDVLVRQLRVTAFQYYVEMMLEVMASEKSYDALPNFTAADCVRVLDIGRNQFIDIMNKCRAKASLFKNKRKIIRSMLPLRSVESEIDYWWTVHLGFISEEDIKNSTDLEHKTIDALIERAERGEPPARAGELDHATVHSLISRGLIYTMVPIANEDQISVPPLEGFVMNRVLGDYFENLLYKIFVSVDERITIESLAEVLQIDVELVKHAVSMYIRLGFAKKKNLEPFVRPEHGESKWHSSWFNKSTSTSGEAQQTTTTTSVIADIVDTEAPKPGHKRIGFVFDSSLTAFLMMGNLGAGLKSHAVTMFEVGKLAEEMLDDFMTELDKVKIDEVGEGEARRYADHALTLAQVLKFLRHNANLQVPDSDGGVDLLRCERMNSLEEATRLRIINKNYAVMVSMAPIAAEANPVTCCIPPHFGPTVSEVNSVWFKLFLYSNVGSGASSVLIPKGTRLKAIPDLFKDCDRVSMYAWDHDTFTQGVYHALPILNDYLLTSPILIQAYCYNPPPTSQHHHPPAHVSKLNRHKYNPPQIDVPFPLDDNSETTLLDADEYNETNMHTHPTVRKIERILGLQYTCGFIRMQKTEFRKNAKSEWFPLDVYFGIPIFSPKLNKQVLERIEKRQLFTEENLKKQSKNSRKLALRLLDFIAKHIQVQDYSKSDRNALDTPRVDIGSVVPQPTRTLTFHDGILS